MLKHQTITNCHSFKEKMTDLTITIETEIYRVLRENNLTELTFRNPVPVIVDGKLNNITDIRLSPAFASEIEFRFENKAKFVSCDDYSETTNLFRFPYMEILMETLETLEPNCLD